MTIEKET